jgi:hypothetical protein
VTTSIVTRLLVEPLTEESFRAALRLAYRARE